MFPDEVSWGLTHLSSVRYQYNRGHGWLNELGRWIQQLIQAHHQYGVGCARLCKLQKKGALH